MLVQGSDNLKLCFLLFPGVDEEADGEEATHCGLFPLEEVRALSQVEEDIQLHPIFS